MAEAEAWVMIPKLDKDKTGCILDMRPLVLCKDCKHRPTQTQPGKAGFILNFPDGSLCPAQCSDGYYSWYPPDNFFCGYGDRKDGENIEKEE